MLKQIRKLNNEKGMSILYALMYLLVLTTIGGLVLSVATSVSGLYSRSKSTQQNYFLVRSAARMLTGELEKASVTISYKEESVYTKEIITDPLSKAVTSEERSKGPYYIGNMNYASDLNDASLKFLKKSEIKNEIQAIFNSQMSQDEDYYQDDDHPKPEGNPSSEDDPIALSFESAVEKAGETVKGTERTVKGTVSISENYNMTIRLWAETEDGKGEAYSILIMVPAKLHVFDGETTTDTVVDDVSEASIDEDWSKIETIYQTTKKTEIKWDKATIVKEN